MTAQPTVDVGPPLRAIPRRSLAALALAVLLVASPPSVMAQPPDASRVLTIEALLHEASGGAAQGPFRPVTVTGVLTAAPVAVSTANVVGYLEDATGAVQLFWRDATQAATNLQAGDLVEVRGTVAVYRGAPELVVAAVRRLRGGPPPRPRDVTVAQLRDPRFAAALVRLTGTLVAPPEFSQSNKGLTLRDRSGEIPVFVSTRLLRDVRFAAQVVRGGSVVLVGIADPRDAPAGAVVSRVIVGTAQDLQFIVANQTWLTVVAIVVTSAGAVAYFWWRRRQADQRAQVLTALTKNLTSSEDALRRSEGRLRAFIDGAAFGIYRANREGRFLEFNPALTAMLGYDSAEELVSLTLPVDVYQTPTDRDRMLETCRTQGGVRNLECVWKRKDGRLITVRVSGRLAPQSENGAEIFEMIAEDVTEQRVLEAQLRKVEETHDRRLVNVFRHAPIGIAILRGPEHVFEFANEPYLDVIGHRPVLGKTFREAFSELDAQGVSELLDGVYTSGQPLIAESLRVTLSRSSKGAPEERFFKFVYQPMLDEEGRAEGIAVVATDVTELTNARRDAESASRAKDEFIAMLSHELRNPLSPILTALQLMRLRGTDTAERERTIIERQVKHLVVLVDDLLDVSRITSGKVDLDKTPVELADVIATAVETTSPLLEQRRHTLDIQVARRGLSVDADADRLAQVVANLLTNAAKYTEPEGHIRVAAERDGDVVMLTVQDDGIGIEADLLPKVFTLFTQAVQSSDRSRGGLGLGLAIVRSLVALHGGTVTVSSDGPGRGTTFVVRLPFVPIPDVDVHEEGGQVAVHPRGPESRRVLIVDDNEDSAEMIAAALTALGHDTRVALDGPSALNLAMMFQPDVALLDIGLPVMDGHELARRLKAEPATRQIRLIAMTGYGQPRDRVASAEAGFDAHLVKPVDLDQLAHILTPLATP